MSWIERLEQVAAAAEAWGATIEQRGVGWPAMPEVLARARAAYPLLPPALWDFAAQHDGLKLNWYLETEDETFGGEINLPPIDFMLGGPAELWDADAFEDVLWSDDEPDDMAATRALRQRARLVDYRSGEEVFTLVDPDDGRLHLVQGRRVLPLTLDIETYWAAAFDHLGLAGWQHLCVVGNPDTSFARRARAQLTTLLGPAPTAGAPPR